MNPLYCVFGLPPLARLVSTHNSLSTSRHHKCNEYICKKQGFFTEKRTIRRFQKIIKIKKSALQR